MATKTAPTPPSTDRAGATRRQILDVAARAFAEHGYRGISLNDIVRDSGLTKGAFYFHFPSKEAIALAVFRDKQESWVGQTMSAVMQRPRAIDQLEAMLDVGCDIHEKDASARVVGRLCIELASDPELTSRMTPHLTTWFDITEQLIRRAQKEGDVRSDIDPRMAAETIVAAFMGIEHVSEAMSGFTDFRRRIDGLRTFAFAALKAKR